MSATDQKEPGLVAPAKETAAFASDGFASRDAILNCAGKFEEEVKTIEGLGKVVLSEISGDARADILGKMMSTFEDGKLKDPTWTGRYQRLLLQHGLVDPQSPAGARTPLFSEADIDRLMKLGGGKVMEMVTAIEKLSKMGRFMESAEGDSVPTPSVASTSG